MKMNKIFLRILLISYFLIFKCEGGDIKKIVNGITSKIETPFKLIIAKVQDKLFRDKLSSETKEAFNKNLDQIELTINKMLDAAKPVLEAYKSEFPNLSKNINEKVGGRRLLRVLVERRDAKSIEDALNLGADPSLVDDDDYTPLLVAAEHNVVDAINLILSRYPEIVNQKSQGVTPLRRAVELGRNEAVEALLNKKADQKVKGNDGLSTIDIIQQGIGRAKTLNPGLIKRITG